MGGAVYMAWSMCGRNDMHGMEHAWLERLYGMKHAWYHAIYLGVVTAYPCTCMLQRSRGSFRVHDNGLPGGVLDMEGDWHGHPAHVGHSEHMEQVWHMEQDGMYQ